MRGSYPAVFGSEAHPAFEVLLDGDGIVPARASLAVQAREGGDWVVQRRTWLPTVVLPAAVELTAAADGSVGRPVWNAETSFAWRTLVWPGTVPVAAPAGSTVSVASLSGLLQARLRLR